jgi:hypothetical protein
MEKFAKALGAVGVIACALAGPGAAPARADAMLDRMLAWAPAPDEPVWSGPIVFGYSRTDLMFAAAGGGDAGNATELLAQTRFTAPSIMTILAYPPGFFTSLMHAERWPALLGFDVTAVDAILTTGEPPTMVEIYAGPPALTDRAALAAALEPRGFALKDIAGVPVWARFEDGRISIADREPADPFGGSLGQASRVAAEDGVLVRTSSSAPLAAAIAASQGGPSLAREPAVQALLKAFGDETVVQVTMFGPQAADPTALLLGPDADPAAIAEQLAKAAGEAGLPGYYLAALGDVAGADGNWRTVLAFAFPDAASADAAAPILVERARTALPADLYGTVEATRVDVAMPGFAVVRLDITAAGEGTPLRRLFQMLMRRDAAIWAVGPAL